MPDTVTTTQSFLDIYDITNDLLLMKDGTTSLIMIVDAMNFGLLAEAEQDAIMYAYAGLLNSLNYPIQIVINSRTKDVTTYLKLLEQQESETSSPIMQGRIRKYREFVSNLIHDRNVLDKKFYVVIPASPLELGMIAPSSVLPGKQSPGIESMERSVIIEKAIQLLEPKRDHLAAQFARIGLFSRQLTTQEIIELFYIKYNPEAAEGQHIAESSSYSAPLVRARIQGEHMDAQIPTNPAPAATPEPMAPVVPMAPMPPAAPAMPAPTMPEPMVPTADESTTQADLNATVQELGQAPITPIPPGGMAAPTAPAPTETPVATPAAPPMPEI
ncbi:MAG: hypothetical protein GW947_03400 [Candidatus Pacebacteria bacterium]|nr:hypothetical protein [Candidatus Paceibacterota bacterium]